MDTQLLLPSPAVDFNFDSTSTSPYATAPSSPNISFPNFFYSTPTSPSHVPPINPNSTQSFQQNHEQISDDCVEDDADFAFDFSGQLEPPSISAADELFHGGKIKPLEPPQPNLKSLKSCKKKYVEPFSEAFHRTPGDQNHQTQNTSPRGREITTTTTTRHKSTRSLSPMRISDVLLSDNQKLSTNQSSSPFGFAWYNKWNLKNLLLFRSTSEGSAMITKGDQDVKNSSFRSSDNGGGGSGSVGGSSRRMKRKLSAHEIHYTANRAVAEEMRRKTFLPYKSGLLGCLGFGHNIHEMSRRR